MFSNIQLLGTSVASVVKDFQGVFNGLPMLGIALIGFAFAAISYKNSSNKTVIQSQEDTKSESKTLDGGEIDDDEI